MMTEKNPPGSDEAVEAGCKCPVLDNCYGRGAYLDKGKNPVYWISQDCPLHRDETTDEKNTKIAEYNFCAESPCIYEGRTLCRDCPRAECDMKAGRELHRKCFVKGWSNALKHLTQGG